LMICEIVIGVVWTLSAPAMESFNPQTETPSDSVYILACVAVSVTVTVHWMKGVKVPVAVGESVAVLAGKVEVAVEEVVGDGVKEGVAVKDGVEVKGGLVAVGEGVGDLVGGRVEVTEGVAVKAGMVGVEDGVMVNVAEGVADAVNVLVKIGNSVLVWVAVGGKTKVGLTGVSKDRLVQANGPITRTENIVMISNR